MSIRTAPKSERPRLQLHRVHNHSLTSSVGGSDQQTFARAIREGLLGRPKSLPFTFFYDEFGSLLFEEICHLPEYYLTRTEDSILRDHAGEMVDGWPIPPTLIELGSGSAEKTQRLISAAISRYGWLHFVPIDVSGSALEDSAKHLVRMFPALRVTGLVGDYHAALGDIEAKVRGPKLIVFLGSSLGNYEPEAAVALLSRLAEVMCPNDRLLLGTDLVKDPTVLERAYDDAQGVTAQFNRNLLVRINREFRANCAIDQFGHRAVYRTELGRVEMHLVSLIRQTVTIPGAGMKVMFEEGESIHTENSHKYSREGLEDLAKQSGFFEEFSWTDTENLFRVQRWRTA